MLVLQKQVSKRSCEGLSLSRADFEAMWVGDVRKSLILKKNEQSLFYFPEQKPPMGGQNCQNPDLKSATGLMYFRARYFDVDLGRFIGRDPLGTALQGDCPRVGINHGCADEYMTTWLRYHDGMNLYAGWFAMRGGVDPMGLLRCCSKQAEKWETYPGDDHAAQKDACVKANLPPALHGIFNSLQAGTLTMHELIHNAYAENPTFGTWLMGAGLLAPKGAIIITAMMKGVITRKISDAIYGCSDDRVCVEEVESETVARSWYNPLKYLVGCTYEECPSGSVEWSDFGE